MASDDLIAFLRAQLDEDERTAQHAGADCWHECGDADLAHHDRFDSARVLREVEAKRQIVQLHSTVHRQVGWLENGDEENAEIPVCGSCVPKHSYYGRRADVPEGPCLTARLLALPYADHDDYQESWKP